MSANYYRLGAEELIELGSGRQRRPHSRMTMPFLAGRERRPMVSNSLQGIGDLLAGIGGFLVDILEFGFNTLGDFIDIPMNILSQGIDILFIDGLGGILKQIPFVGELLSQIVVLGGSLLKFGLSIPGLALHGLGNVMGNIGEALNSNFTESENQQNIDKSKDDIIGKAPDELKDNVKAILDAGGVSGSDLVPGFDKDKGEYKGTTPPTDKEIESVETGTPIKSDLEKALMIGAPVAGVAAILLLAG